MTELALPPCRVARTEEATTGAEWQQQHPTWLHRGISAGVLVNRWGPDGEEELPVALHALGALPLPDGRVVAGDPYAFDRDAAPLDERVAPGTHPVGTAVVTVEPDHWRTTALLLVAGSAPIVRWSMGRPEPRPGHPVRDPAAFDVGEFTGSPVEVGTGCLCGPAAMAAFVEAVQDRAMFDDPVTAAVDASRFGAALAAPTPDAPPMAVCLSGWGDGVYPTWLGHAADGSVVLVMTDFLVVNDPYVEQ